METALILAETVFYFTVSVAIITIGIFCAILLYHLIRIVRALKEISQNLHDTTTEVGERIIDIIDRLSSFPILSYFLKKYSPSREKKQKK